MLHQVKSHVFVFRLPLSTHCRYIAISILVLLTTLPTRSVADYNPYFGAEIMPILARYKIDGASDEHFEYAFLNMLLGFRINEYFSIESAYAFDLLNFQDDPTDYISVDGVAALYVKARYPFSDGSGVYLNLGGNYTHFTVSDEIRKTQSSGNAGAHSSFGFMGGVGADYSLTRNLKIYGGFTWYPLEKKSAYDIDLYVSNLGIQYFLPGL